MPSWSPTPSHLSLSAGNSQPFLLSPFLTEVILTPAPPALVLAHGKEVWLQGSVPSWCPPLSLLPAGWPSVPPRQDLNLSLMFAAGAEAGRAHGWGGCPAWVLETPPQGVSCSFPLNLPVSGQQARGL